MSYVDKSLAEGEEIIMRGRWPLAYWVIAWVLLLGLGLFVVGVVLFLMMALHMLTTEFAVTNQRVALKRGWLM